MKKHASHGSLETGIVVVALLACACLLLQSAPAAGAEEFTTQSWAPDFSAKDLSGKTVTLSECTKEGPVIVVFWASWCKGCKNLMSEIDRLHQKYRDRGFRAIAVAGDDQKSILRVKPTVTQNKWQMIVVTDLQKEISNSFNVRNYPTTFLVTRDRAIAGFYQGYMPGLEKQFEAKVVELLSKDSTQTAVPAAKGGAAP